jgi:hypothetical protein
MIQININDIANKVRNTVLTGLNVALTGAIVATDTVIEAFGKLQNQINEKVSKSGDLTMSGAKVNAPEIRATTSAGIAFKSNNGTAIAEAGAGGGGNWAFEDGVKLNGGTANRLLQTDANKNIAYVPAITANRALVSDANGIPTASTVSDTTLAFLDATSSVQTQLNEALKNKCLGTITSPSSHTGNAVNTILGFITINEGDVIAGDVLDVYVRMFRTNANGTITGRFYLSTSSTSIAGATLLGVMTNTTNQFTLPISRELFVVDDTTVGVFATGSTVAANDENVGSTASQNETVPTFASVSYLVITGQTANSSDIVTLQGARLNRFRP